VFSGKNGKGKHEDLEQSKEAQCSSRVRRMAKELVYIYIYIYIFYLFILWVLGLLNSPPSHSILIFSLS